MKVACEKYRRDCIETENIIAKRSELLIDAASAEILPASDSEHRPRRGGVRLPHRDPSGER